MCQSQSQSQNWTWRNFHQVPSLALFVFSVSIDWVTQVPVTYLVTGVTSPTTRTTTNDNRLGLAQRRPRHPQMAHPTTPHQPRRGRVSHSLDRSLSLALSSVMFHRSVGFFVSRIPSPSFRMSSVPSDDVCLFHCCLVILSTCPLPPSRRLAIPISLPSV